MSISKGWNQDPNPTPEKNGTVDSGSDPWEAWNLTTWGNVELRAREPGSRGSVATAALYQGEEPSVTPACHCSPDIRIQDSIGLIAREGLYLESHRLLGYPVKRIRCTISRCLIGWRRKAGTKFLPKVYGKCILWKTVCIFKIYMHQNKSVCFQKSILCFFKSPHASKSL